MRLGDWRHPGRLALQAWFDGEGDDELAWHIGRCARCFARVERLAAVRQAVRSAATAPPGVPVEPTGPAAAAAGREGTARLRWHVRGRSVLAGIGALAMVAGAAGAAAAAGGALRGAPHHAGSGPIVSRSAPASLAPAAAPSPGPRTASRAGGSAPAGAGSGTGVTPGPAPAPAGAAPSGLHLAVIVPTAGPEASEGAAVVAAVTRAVDLANATGGVRGAPVSLQVVSAQDPAAIASLAGSVDAVVGGFGATPPTGVPWLLPADPLAQGTDVVPAELDPATVGADLAGALVASGLTGPVGVVEGSGPEAAMASGVATRAPTVDVPLPTGTGCVPALTTLRARAVAAVALATDPAGAASCLQAMAALGWQPPGGVLVAPSAAYAGLATGTAGVAGVTTMLGLPWPTAPDDAGAALFRSEAPGITSYRALVSFAAVELAVEVARSAGTVTLGAVSAGSWHSGLVDFSGTTDAGVRRVVASGGGWVAS